MGILKGIWDYRGFILGSVKREFQTRYHASMLGAAWTVLNPLAMIVIYTVIFSRIMHARLPGSSSSFAYSIFLCAGMLTWGIFTEITGRCQSIFLDNANLIKKLSFPRLCLPVIVVLSSGLNFCIIFGLFTVFLIVTGSFPGWSFLAVFPVLAIEIAVAIGLGIIVGVLNVFFRDVGQFFSIIMQFWFWFTPIVYPIKILPEAVRPYMSLNPMAPLINAYQTIMVSGEWPQWRMLVPAGLTGIILCILAFSLFRRRAGEMVDEL